MAGGILRRSEKRHKKRLYLKIQLHTSDETILLTKAATEEKEKRNDKLIEIVKENTDAGRLWAKLEGILDDNMKYRIIEFIFVEMPNTRFFHPRGSLKEEWKVFYGNSFGDARREARRGTAGMPRDRAWRTAGDAILDAARIKGQPDAFEAVLEAAMDATEEVAGWDALLEARGDVTPEVIKDAAWDSALIAGYLLVEDVLDFNIYKENIGRYVMACKEIWQKGHVRLCDVGGTPDNPFGGMQCICARTPAGLRT